MSIPSVTDRHPLAYLEEACEEIMRCQRTKNTEVMYAHYWKDWRGWCEHHGCQPLPSSPDLVRLYVAWCLLERERTLYVSSVKVALAAITYRHRQAGHPSPIDDGVRFLLRNAARMLKQRSKAREPLTPDLLVRALRVLPESPRGIRDRAILLVGFASSWRSEEIARLRTEYVAVEQDGMSLLLPHSKTDQEAKGRRIWIPRGQSEETCPVQALETWLDRRGRGPGPLFTHTRVRGRMPVERGIRPQLVYQVVQRTLGRAGIDPNAYGAHSLRSGMITTAIENNAPLTAIQERSGHARIQSLMRYVRQVERRRVDPLAGVL